jgi:hypothetical protein
VNRQQLEAAIWAADRKRAGQRDALAAHLPGSAVLAALDTDFVRAVLAAADDYATDQAAQTIRDFTAKTTKKEPA